MHHMTSISRIWKVYHFRLLKGYCDVIDCMSPPAPTTQLTIAPVIPMLKSIAQALEPLGLRLRGGMHVAPGDKVPALPDGSAAQTLLLVGNAGPALWRAFAAAPEYADGQSHPLNRWTRRQLDAVAIPFGGTVLYPFDEAPAWPFQRWAARCEAVHQSPLGLLVHPQYGLWHAYRGAILVAPVLELAAPAPVPSPCQSCTGQPCLSRCPVGAFTPGGYNVAACAAHLALPEGQDCLGAGCLARRACPVGADFAQAAAQNAFHMRAFRDAVAGAKP